MKTAVASRALVASAAVALALIGVLVFLVSKTRAVDFESHNEIIGDLRLLKQIDAEWNADVLRSKMGLNNNYDPVASPLPAIDALGVKLTDQTQQLGASGQQTLVDLRALLDQHKALMDKKIATIEQFKSQNSIMRNSLHYLPVAAAEMIAAARTEEPTPAKRVELESAVSRLLSDAMTYVQIPDVNRRLRIESDAKSLGDSGGQYAKGMQERIEVYVSHVATLLRQDEIGRTLLADLSKVETAKSIDSLSDAYNREHDNQLLEQQTFRTALIAYSGFLLLLLAFYAWRLVTSYRLLNGANAELVETNQRLKESQVQLVQSEKMSALGQMVAGIAHEINTPLAFVKGTLDVVVEHVNRFADLALRSHQLTVMMRNRSTDKNALNLHFARVEQLSKEIVEHEVLSEAAQLLTDGTRGIDQIAEIVINLKNFSRLDRAKTVEFDVREGLESTLLLAKNLLKNKVTIKKEFEDLPKILCAPSQINQVFLNIITNATHAIPERGEITLRAMRHDDDSVRVEIEDNGTGIPANVLPKIFDPFFTTKEVGKGTGMGLSISYKIIQEHGGKITVDTEAGLGTTFSIILPARPPEVQSIAEEPEAEWREAA